MVRFDKRKGSMLASCLLALCLTASLAHAHDDDDEEEERHQRHEHREHSSVERERHASVISDHKLKEECGSCHIVYPPNMLPVESWRALMANLNKHFGTDASLDEVTRRELSTLLQNQAEGRAERSSSGKPILRISETGWFKDEHDEVSARTWRNPKVKSASNCEACHTKAEQGRFGEHEVRIPR